MLKARCLSRQGTGNLGTGWHDCLLALTRPWEGGTWPRRYSMLLTQEAESTQADRMLVWLTWAPAQRVQRHEAGISK